MPADRGIMSIVQGSQATPSASVSELASHRVSLAALSRSVNSKLGYLLGLTLIRLAY